MQEGQESRRRGIALSESLQSEIAGNDDLMPEVYGDLVTSLTGAGEEARAADVSAKLAALAARAKNAPLGFGAEVRLGFLLYDRQKYRDAEMTYRQAMKLLPSAGDQSAYPECILMHQVGVMLELQKKFPEAEQMLRRSIQSQQSYAYKNEFELANTMSWLGAAIAGQGRYGEAEPMLLDAYKRLSVGPDSDWKAKKNNAINRIINFYEVSSKSQKANEWRAKLPTTVPTTAP
jgi:tetratricopeptide (TPR) repeat protein